MGMFDYVRCEVPLPDGWEGELQTKDFGCDMGEHVITKEGHLLLAHLVGTSVVPKNERPYPDEPDNSPLNLAGSIRFHWEMRDAEFHGVMHFGGLETIGYEPDDRYGPRGRPIYRSHDYVAKFTDGNLVSITEDPDA